MKKSLLSLFLLLAVSLGFIACNEDDTVDYSDYYEWKNQNNDVMLRMHDYQKRLGQNAYFTDTIVSQA